MRQLLVRLLQLALLSLKFRRQLLRLLQQRFGLHRRLDTVQHDTDARRQLLEKREVRGREPIQRGEFDDRLNAILKEHREYNHVPRLCFEQPGAYLNTVPGKIVDQHASKLQRARAA